MNTLLFLRYVLLLVFMPLFQSPGDKILGTWADEEGIANMEIYKKGEKYSAMIVWLSEPLDSEGKPKTDKLNPDPSKRNQPILGLDIITDLKYSGGSWKEGQIYGPRRGEYASCSVKLVSGDKLEVTTGKGFITVKRTWERVTK